MADNLDAQCAAVTAVIPVPSSHDAELPTGNGSGIFTDVVNPVAGDSAASFEPIYIPYKARGEGDDPSSAYSQTLTDGYARLTQISHRVVSQCPDTKLVLLGQGQGGHLVSVFASEIGKGNAVIPDESVAFAATISDPTRAAGQSLFPGVPGQSAPVSWEGAQQCGRLPRVGQLFAVRWQLVRPRIEQHDQEQRSAALDRCA
ncbi:cutinase family protein [Dietzia aerolata]|uniref:cutinase family protein n=1 Tax=Dietzia aerolata TaxID=595984 RepID=UPI0036454D05